MYFLIAGLLIITITLTLFLKRKAGPAVKNYYGNYFKLNPNRNLIPYPDYCFAVISDPHYYDRSLGDHGPAFHAYLLTDRKLLLNSVELLTLAIDELVNSDIEALLIPGDLSTEGELKCHLGLARSLSRLKEAGKKVFIIPGNHDINMRHSAVAYHGKETKPTETVSAELFCSIYYNFGYSEALYRDENSLSYIAELKDGLWLAALDTCRYAENTPEKEFIGSRITRPFLEWLTMVLQEAFARNKKVIAMIHHGVVEHWPGQGRLHRNYLVNDYKRFSRLLASYGVRLAFTGHYHAQDISMANFGDGEFIYDVETGSLITPPCPVRYCSISNSNITIKTDHIIDKLRPGTGFSNAANEFMMKTLELEIHNTLKKYLVRDADADLLAGYIAKAFAAHSRGDEKPSDKPLLDIGRLSIWGKVIYMLRKRMIDALWNDTGPPDLNVTLDLVDSRHA